MKELKFGMIFLAFAILPWFVEANQTIIVNDNATIQGVQDLLEQLLGTQDEIVTDDEAALRPPLYLQHLYDKMVEEDEVNGMAMPPKFGMDVKQMPSIVAARKIDLEDPTRLKFEVNASEIPIETLRRAELVFKRRTHDFYRPYPPQQFTIRVFQITNEGEQLLMVHDLLETTTFHSDFEVLNVTELAIQWLRDPESNHGIRISMERRASNRTELVENEVFQRAMHLNAHGRHAPSLLLYQNFILEEIRGRRKRNTDALLESYTRRGWDDAWCQVRKWYVPFQSTGMMYVLKPEGWSINYCSGSCPAAYLHNKQFNVSANSFARAMYHYTMQGRAESTVPDAMCVPTAYRTVNVIYAHRGHFELKRLESMEATACGCL